MPTRRQFLAAAPAVFMACKRTPRPNILFVLADDMSFPHAGAYGDKTVRTPHFDRVAREGVLFTNSFSCCPSCTPSRTSILSGRAIWQTAEGGVLYGTLPKRYPVFTHLLARAGYHTGFTGKGWGPGNWLDGGLKKHPNGKQYNSMVHAKPVPAGIDQRDYAANFEQFLAERPAGAPFCFWFGCTEPHRVYEPGIGLKSGKRLEDVRVPPFLPDTAEIRSDLLDYYFEVEWFDTQLGRLIAILEKTGELDNTLVVVTSDNGMPFPRAKTTLYDWGVHMPLAIRWGNRVVTGERREFVSHMDFAVTFLEAAGIHSPPAMKGRSLLPLLLSVQPDPSRNCVYTGFERHTMCRPDGATYPMRAIRTSEYLYIRNYEPSRWPTGGEFLSSNKTTHGDVDACPSKTFMLTAKLQPYHDMAFGRRPADELYRLAEDPGQIRNLAQVPELAAVRAQLREALENHLKRTGDPRMQGKDPWQEYVYHQTTGYGASFNRSLSEAERRQARERDTHKPE